MSFEGKVAISGNYHDADVEVVSDERNWPRGKQQKQNSQQVAKTTKDEQEIEVVESDDDAVADDEDAK